MMRIMVAPYKQTAEPGQGRVYDYVADDGFDFEEFTWRRAFRADYDVLHMHYPEAAVRKPGLVRTMVLVSLTLALFARLRARRIPLVGSGHNVRSHEQYHPRLERLVFSAFDRNVHAMTYPSETSMRQVQLARPRLARRPNVLLPIVNYEWDRHPVGRSDARDALNLPADASVVLFLGLIRRYKNVPHLIRMVQSLGQSDVCLLVAGNPDDEVRAEVETAAANDPNIRLTLRYVEPDEVTMMMAAADLVALPFQKILNSGSALLALSHERPVLVPRAGALTELADRAGSKWFTFFDPEAGLTAPDLAAALEKAASLPDDAPDLSWCDLKVVADETASFYRSLPV